MKNNILALIYMILLYLIISIPIQIIPYATRYFELHLPKFISFVVLYPLKLVFVISVIYGIMGDFYLWWKIKPVIIVQKIVVWISRIGIAFLVIITLPQIAFLLFDSGTPKDVALDTIRYNWIYDLGIKSAAALIAYQIVANKYLKQPKIVQGILKKVL